MCHEKYLISLLLLCSRPIGLQSAMTQTLMQASMKLGEAMYKQSQEGAPAEGAAEGGAKPDDVVDAEFTEVDDDKKNKKSA